MFQIFKISLLFLCYFYTLPMYSQSSAFRRVLLFASNQNDTFLIRQNQILKSDETGCRERDIKIESYIFNQTDKNILSKYAIKTPQYTFILVGKDGGIRLRSTKIISKEQLFALIDTMPMRKDEMKRMKKQ